MSADLGQQTPTDQALFSKNNHLFQLAEMGHVRLPGNVLGNNPDLLNKIIYPIATILFGFLVPFLSVIFGLPIRLPVLLGLVVQETAVGQAIFLIGSFLPIFLLIWFWLWLFERRPFWTVGLERPFLKKYLRGLLVGLIMFSLAVIILSTLGMVEIETPVGGRFGLISLVGTAIIFLGWIVQGAAEEVLARGFLLPVIGLRWGPVAGILISSIFFAFLHLLNPNVTWISILNLALFGLFAALYALYEGRLWGVFAIHSIWNWAQGNLFGFEVSGMSIQSGLIFDLMEAGPDWITGGLFGPEGGIIITIILLAGSLLLWIAGKRRELTSGDNGK